MWLGDPRTFFWKGCLLAGGCWLVRKAVTRLSVPGELSLSPGDPRPGSPRSLARGQKGETGALAGCPGA